LPNLFVDGYFFFLLGGRQKSQAQQDRRRERNRILAFFESLQKDVADLQRENGWV